MAMLRGIRGQSQPFLKSAVTRGLSSSETIKSLRQAGLGYRRTDMLADYREWAQVPQKANVIRYVRRDYLPSRAMYVETFGKQRAAYRYQVTGNIYNPVAKDTVKFTTNVVSDFQMTPQQVYDEGIPPVETAVGKSEYEITDYHLEGAFYKVGGWD